MPTLWSCVLQQKHRPLFPVESKAAGATFWLVWASARGQPCPIGVFRLCFQPTLPFPQAEGPKACSYLMEVTHLPHVTSHFLIRFKDLPNFSFCLLVFTGSFPTHGHQGALCQGSCHDDVQLAIVDEHLHEIEPGTNAGVSE